MVVHIGTQRRKRFVSTAIVKMDIMTFNFICTILVVYVLSYYIAKIIFVPECYVEVRNYNGSIVVKEPDIAAYFVKIMLLICFASIISFWFKIISPCDIPVRDVLVVIGFSLWACMVMTIHTNIWINRFVDEVNINDSKRVIRY